MKLEQQCVSLELATQLKKLGVKQDSLYWYVMNEGGKRIESSPHYARLEEDVSAFTVAELGEIMKNKGMGITAHTTLGGSEWWVRGGEWIVEEQQYSNLETDEKWADCLAKMLIYLLENNLL